ncbi:MAG: hypothetical protein AAF518_02510 [Spirochaetota bacterium]
MKSSPPGLRLPITPRTEKLLLETSQTLPQAGNEAAQTTATSVRANGRLGNHKNAPVACQRTMGVLTQKKF